MNMENPENCYVEETNFKDKAKKWVQENLENLIFTVIFFILFFLFIWVNVPERGTLKTDKKKCNNPLVGLLVMLSMKPALLAGLLKKDDIKRIKEILFQVVFPCLVFVSLSNLNTAKFLEYAVFFGYGLGCDFAVFLITNVFLFWCYKLRRLTKEQFMVSAFTMGCLACGSTTYPYVESLSGDSGSEFQKITMMDFGNKIWTLPIVYLIIVFTVKRESLNCRRVAKDILYPMATTPIIVAFLLAIMFILSDVKCAHMKVSGVFIEHVKNASNFLIMAFIGLKLEVPKTDNLQVFIPIFIRRAVSMALVCIIQVFAGYEHLTFITLLMFAQSANSVWPYAHLTKIVDEDDKRVDMDFMVQLSAYDYSFATILNMILSLSPVESRMNVWVGFIISAILLVIGLALLIIKPKRVDPMVNATSSIEFKAF